MTDDERSATTQVLRVIPELVRIPARKRQRFPAADAYLRAEIAAAASPPLPPNVVEHRVRRAANVLRRVERKLRVQMIPR